MQTRPLGNTGERVSALGFGCMGLVGWYGERNDAEAAATLLAAVDGGVTHLDTAASYQVGENEKFVGATLGARRKEVFLASKCGLAWKDGKLGIDNSPALIASSCEGEPEAVADRSPRPVLSPSHRPDGAGRGVRGRAREAREGRQGSAHRAVGVQSGNASERRQGSPHRGGSDGVLRVVPWRESAILPACREVGAAFVAYSPLGRGFLAGNFRSLADLPKDDARRNQPRFVDGNVEHNLAIADAVHGLAQRKGAAPAQIALAWVLAQGEDILPIPGTKRRERQAENAASVNVKLSVAELLELTSTIEKLSVKGERYPPAMMNALNG